ncbi:MAG: hypothetical protein ACE361_06810 [Aureliella sp.]
MQLLENSHRDTNSPVNNFLDMKTIRQRVARIKRGWSPETAKARSAEGQRRRRELEDMVLDLICDVDGSEESCDLESHGFSLVG